MRSFFIAGKKGSHGPTMTLPPKWKFCDAVCKPWGPALDQGGYLSGPSSLGGWRGCLWPEGRRSHPPARRREGTQRCYRKGPLCSAAIPDAQWGMVSTLFCPRDSTLLSLTCHFQLWLFLTGMGARCTSINKCTKLNTILQGSCAENQMDLSTSLVWRLVLSTTSIQSRSPAFIKFPNSGPLQRLQAPSLEAEHPSFITDENKSPF